MMNVKALMIDFGDTLAYVNETRSKGYTGELWSAVREGGYNSSFSQFEELWGKTLRQSSKGQVKSFSALWRLLLTELSMHENATLMKQLDRIRKTHSNNLFRLYERVPQTLSELQKKYKLILVSNCAYGLSETIVRLGLNKFFSNIILSYEVGARKPDRLIYTKALENSGLKPEDCMFIADEISDLEGAREIGMKTLLVRQGKSTFCEIKDPNFQPDVQCNEISEVLQVL
jgi:putative hydrolase of the HAD superfamily